MQVKLFDSSVDKFIKSLEKQTIAKVLRTIDLLELFGYKLTMPHAKKIRKNLYELRVHGAQNMRILYTLHGDSAILLHCFIKKSQRTRNREITIALQKIKKLDSI